MSRNTISVGRFGFVAVTQNRHSCCVSSGNFLLDSGRKLGRQGTRGHLLSRKDQYHKRICKVSDLHFFCHNPRFPGLWCIFGYFSGQQK